MQITWWKIEKNEKNDMDCKVTEMLIEQRERKNLKWDESYTRK